MENLYLLDIDTEGRDKTLVHGALRGRAGVQHLFKGDVDEHVDRLAESKVHKVSCTPLMPYEQFASQIFEMTGRAEGEEKGKAAPFIQGQDIYWLHFSVGYKGRTLEELLKAWCDEATLALSLIHGGQVPIALYKSVAMREVHAFIQMDGGALDKMFFELPIMKVQGHTLDELLKAWHDEAVAALGLVHGGQVPVAIYKSVAMRQVHLFIQMEAGALDKTSFTLPIIKALGDQVNIVTRAIRLHWSSEDNETLQM